MPHLVSPLGVVAPVAEVEGLDVPRRLVRHVARRLIRPEVSTRAFAPRQPRGACVVREGMGKSNGSELGAGARRGIRNAFARRRRAEGRHARDADRRGRRGRRRATLRASNRIEDARTRRRARRSLPALGGGEASSSSSADPPNARDAPRGESGRTVRLRAVRVTCARRLVRRFARTAARPNVFAGVRSAPRSGAPRRASGARTRAMRQTGTVRPKVGKKLNAPVSLLGQTAGSTVCLTVIQNTPSSETNKRDF